MSFPDFRMRRLGLSAVAAIAAVTIVTAAAAQSMVVRSTGPSAAKYPTGAKLKPADKLTLVAGDKVVLMQAGKTRTLSGPGTFGATGTVQASQSLGGNVTRMLAKGPTMRSRGGSPAATWRHRRRPTFAHPICGCSTIAKAEPSASPIPQP
jgi:hypothetical protein